jgi:sigma-E factor negative regulatory protein RseC
MEPGSIIHPGIIEEINEEKILVKILSQSACSTCHAKGACSVSEVEEKIIEIVHATSGNWRKGQQVMVKMEQSLGLKAVFLGYLAPLIILIASIIVFLFLLKNEGLAALLSIMMLAPYYLTLYLFRDKLKKKFRFRIEESD